MTAPRICIITPNYVCGSPRTVKEADALADAGFDVRVVFSEGGIKPLRIHDDKLLGNKRWRYSVLGWSPDVLAERTLYYLSGIRHTLTRNLPTQIGKFWRLAEIGQGRVYPELARLAAQEPADLYIGHYPDGLAAAAWGARQWNARLAYDFEDFHVGEGGSQNVRERTEIIERRYIQGCVFTSAASEPMSAALAEFYGFAAPIPIHNVFPWSDRNSIDGQVKDRRGGALSIYWYSQTVGLDRGIQDAIRAMGLVPDVPTQLHLRGNLYDHCRDALMSVAVDCGVADRIVFHDRVAPDELLSRAAEHDIGLAAEQPVDVSRQISITNKLFLYLLAGLCVAATDVIGQRRIMETIPDAGYLYPVGDVRALAEILRTLHDNPAELQRRKAAALAAARDRYNWELESQKLVDAVSRAMQQSHKIQGRR